MDGITTKTDRIWALVRMIPSGRVASYGQIAGYIPGVTPRMVGHAMAGSPADVPWQRVINAAGRISAHAGAADQYRLLAAEGVAIDAAGRIDLSHCRWPGPDAISLIEAGLDPEQAFARVHGG